MKYIARLALGSVMILFSVLAHAEEYKTPANMSVEDRRSLMASSSDYERCVITRVQELAPRVGDPRALADAALASCSNMLTDFAEQMTEDNYHPDFSNYYIRKVKYRVANTAVQQAMFISAQKQSPSSADAPAEQPAVTE